MPRGGKRDGAGRPARPGEYVHRAYRLLREDADLIKQTAQDVGISQAEVIHELIEAYKKQCESEAL